MLTNHKHRSIRCSITGTSALALATALVAGPAQAQLSYNAPDPTVASGTVTFQRGVTPGVEVYNVQSPTAVLDFTPSDTTGTGVINFQNAGTNVTYQGTSDFTVLNRIVPTDPTRAIQFNGTVNSRISTTPGGSVWFYSPGGIILGGGAVFDIGSLLLATGDPTGGTGTIGSTTNFSIASAANSNAAVTIQPGAQITATPEGSYVALVAPVVNQNGNVRVNGSAAYVAAEQATLSFSQGLFDIAVTVGSDGTAGVPLTHNGTTGGPSSTGAGDNHGIFMVAVPKNTAITMMIAPNGQLGFDVAASASIENGAIYLQAGGNLAVDTSQSVVNRIIDLPQGAQAANIQINRGNVTSPIAAQASGDVQLSANASGLSLAGDAYFYGGKSARLSTTTNASFTSTGRLILNSFGNGAPGTAQIDALAGSTMTLASVEIRADATTGRFIPAGFDLSTGGSAALRTNGGTINVAGLTQVSAVGTTPPSPAVSTTGGTADITASAGGVIALGSDAFVDASASTSGASLTAAAGQATVFAEGSTIKVANLLSLSANGVGSQGAAGKGGNSVVVTGVNGGGIEAATMTVNADGIGGSAFTGTGGAGTGGSALIQTQDTTATASIKTGGATVSATGDGGNGFSSGTVSGGSATGGMARMFLGTNGSFTATGTTSFDASAVGGDGSSGGNGGDAMAGTAHLGALGGSFAGQGLDLSAFSSAGIGGSAPLSTLQGGAGGNALAGGVASIFADKGSTITATSTSLDGSAFGGSGGGGFSGTGLAGSGGSATASAVSLGATGSAQIVLGDTTLDARAFAGDTGSGLAQAGGTGGAAQAGNIDVVADNAMVQVATLSLRSDADGGFGGADGSNGGSATGGRAAASANNGGTLKIGAGPLTLSATAFGGSATGAASGGVTGGKGVGGVANLSVSSGGTIDSSASFVSLDTGGSGGSVSGSGSGTGGLGQGGHAVVNANAGTITLRGDIDINADGQGGTNSVSGDGGTGIGGEARFGTFGATSASKIDVTGDIFLDASGIGGFASIGKGGDAFGGAPADLDNGPFDSGAYLVAIGGTVSVSGTVDLIATGDAGPGGSAGGTGTGGFATISAFGADITLPGFVQIDASGSGGYAFTDGGNGGAGLGGLGQAAANAGGSGIPLGTPSSITIGTFSIAAAGEGGSGADGAEGAAGGSGGDGTGGRALPVAQASGGSLTVANQMFIFIQGTGGDGGAGGAAPSSGGNGGSGGKGGVGTGGFTNFGTVSGADAPPNVGRATFADVTVFADGIGGIGGDGVSGGNGGDGGAGIGGSGTILSRGNLVTAGAVSIDSSAFGGQGGAGTVAGAGGSAEGGAAAMLVTNRFNRTERGSVVATSFSGSAVALGGNGSVTGMTTAGQALAQLTNADATLDSLTLSSFGDNPPPAGSESGILVDNGALTVNTGASVSSVGDLAFGVVNGGVLKADFLSLSMTGSLLPPAAGTPGLIDVGSGFFASFGGDFITTADFDVTGSFNLNTDGNLQVGKVTSGGDVSLSSAGTLTTGDINAADSIFLFAAGDILTGNLTAALGNQSLVFGDIEVGGTGAISLGNVTGATIDIFTDASATPPLGNISTGNLTAETISVDGGANVSTGNLKAGDFYSGIDTSLDNYLIGVAAGGNVTVGNVDTPTSAGLAARTGSLTAGTITVGDSALLLAKTDINTGGIAGGTGSGSHVFLSNISVLDTDPVFAGFSTLDDFAFFDPATLGSAVPVRLDGRIATGAVTTGGFAAAAQGGITAPSINAPNRLLLDSGAALSLGALSTNQALALVSDNAIVLGDVTASTVDLKSVSNISTGAITATTSVKVDSGATAAFSGQVSAPQITVISRDLQLGANGRLGTAATTQLTLNAQGATAFTFGGTGSAVGYSIDGVEAQGLRAQRIDITTSAPAVIQTVALTGAGAGNAANLAGNNGQLTIDSSSGIRVNGALAVNNTTAGNRLTLRSAGTIAVATDNGSITMTGATPGSLGGTLELVGSSIAVATSNLLSQLAGNLNFTGRNQALATPPSNTPKPEGFIQANRLELSAVDLIAIQNSGSATQFAGFSAGAGGMQVTSRAPSTAALDLFIFGRAADSSGAFKTNEETIGLVGFAGGSTPSLTATSAVNNCLFGGSSCDAQPVMPPAQEVIVDRIPAAIQDVVEGALASTSDPENVAALPVVRLVTTVDTAPLRTDPLIADPVSGGGNPSLWEGNDDQNERREDGTQPAPGQGGDQ